MCLSVTPIFMCARRGLRNMRRNRGDPRISDHEKADESACRAPHRASLSRRARSSGTIYLKRTIWDSEVFKVFHKVVLAVKRLCERSICGRFGKDFAVFFKHAGTVTVDLAIMEGTLQIRSLGFHSGGAGDPGTV